MNINFSPKCILSTVKFMFFVALFLFNTNQVQGQIALTPDDTYLDLDTRLNKARLEMDSEVLADTYFRLAEFYEYRNFNSAEALNHYEIARQYYGVLGREDRVNFIDRLLAKRFAKSGFHNEALTIYKSILPYYESIDDKKTIAFIMFEISEVYRKKGDPELNMEYLNRSIRANSKIKDSDLQFLFLNSKIESYIILNELDSALAVSFAYLSLGDKTTNWKHMGKALYFIGQVNFLNRDYNKAIKYLTNSLEITPNEAYSEERRDILNSLSESYSKLRKYKEAYKFSRNYNSLNDSILNIDRLRVINELTIRQHFSERTIAREKADLEIEKESALQKSTRQRRMLYFVGLVFLGLLTLLYFLIRFYNVKMENAKIINDQKHEIDQQQIRELEDSMQINSMQSMIVGQEKERERIAKDLHDSLGGLLSTVKLQFDGVKSKLQSNVEMDQYDKASTLLDTAVEEVRTISRNLQPSALKKLGIISALKDLINRFEGENNPEIFFQYYDVPEKMDEMVALSIYRVIQELLNNSIKYAEADEILIQLNHAEDELYLQYEDDGVGFIFDEHLKKGMGLENIQSRINFMKGQMSIESMPDDGISVLIRIPMVVDDAAIKNEEEE